MDSSNRKVPVFVFPTSLKFYVNSRQTHKQLLTVYNPYDFPVKFKVLSTAPNKYAVIDPEGSMGPLSCVDIVIRHTMPISGNCNVIDKFRITMQDHSTKQMLGKRDVEAKLIAGEPDNNSDTGENFQSLPHVDRNVDEHKSQEYTFGNMRSAQNMDNTMNYIAIIAGIVCITALLLPTEQEQPKETNVPSYLHLTVNLKLVFAYVLGLVSMVVFRP